jgi:hypothetical protein
MGQGVQPLSNPQIVKHKNSEGGKMKERMPNTLHQGLKGHYGALAQLAAHTGYSRQHVIDVIKGYRENAYVLREAQRLLLSKESHGI